jgi:putative endonuclease
MAHIEFIAGLMHRWPSRLLSVVSPGHQRFGGGNPADKSVTILDPRRLFGQEGEAEAERYLRRKGYRIIARNIRSSLGELDLVAEDGPVLVFVEVKARRTEQFGGAIHAVHRQKQHKLIRLAAHFLAQRHWTDRSCRFDVVLLESKGSATPRVEHIQNAFDVPSGDLR